MKNIRDKIHIFDNGVKVFDNQLLEVQRERYSINNIHEAEEEEIFLNIINSLKDGAVYVDIGVAIGYYAILAKLLRDNIKVVGFEPLKLHRTYFYKNIKINNFHKNDFYLFSEGIYTKNGFIKFKLHQYSSTIVEEMKKTSFLKKILEVVKGERIKTIRLNEIEKKIGANFIDFIQMDIQGLEYKVMNSVKDYICKHKVGHFLIGTHSEKIHDDCISLLKKCEYEIVVDLFHTQQQPDGIIHAKLKGF